MELLRKDLEVSSSDDDEKIPNKGGPFKNKKQKTPSWQTMAKHMSPGHRRNSGVEDDTPSKIDILKSIFDKPPPDENQEVNALSALNLNYSHSTSTICSWEELELNVPRNMEADTMESSSDSSISTQYFPDPQRELSTPTIDEQYQYEEYFTPKTPELYIPSPIARLRESEEEPEYLSDDECSSKWLVGWLAI